jgi:NAD(P)H dehydrogenase (quinone)
MSAKNIVISGHPNANSFSQALADSLCAGLTNGSDPRYFALRDLEFDPILHGGYSEGYKQDLEPDLRDLQQGIAEADHMILVTPLWWGDMPALVKGMIDRVFLPGFAFKYKKGSALPEQLLKGKSASLIITADTPWWFQKWNRGGLRPLLNSTLRFSGFDIRTIEFFSPVRGSTAEQRQAWIEKVRSLGRKLA